MEQTDPAAEIGELINWLGAIPPAETPTWNSLSLAMGVIGSDLTFFSMCAAILKRIDRLGVLTSEISDPKFDQDQRRHILEAISQVRHVFQMEQLVQPWMEVKPKYVRTIDAVILKLFGLRVRGQHALRCISDADRVQIIDLIDQSIDAISPISSFLPWQRAAIADALEQLKFSVVHTRFFGADEMVQRLEIVESRAMAVRPDGAVERDVVNRLLANIVEIGGRLTLFDGPGKASSSMGHYRNWILESMESAPTDKRLLLVGPAASD